MEEFTFLSNWLLWLIAAAILVIVELLTNTFAAFCLVGGCALALATSLIGFGIEAQLTAAAIGSVLSFIAFKPLIKRQAEARRHRDCLSNMDALIGRTTTVTEAIGGNTPGRVRIDGDNWQAVSADASPIDVGTKVRVTGYDSIILTVDLVDELLFFFYLYGIIDFSRTRHFNCGDSRYGWRKSRASIGNARNRTPRTLPQRVASRTQHHLAFHRQA